jgi:hypothetical protein
MVVMALWERGEGKVASDQDFSSNEEKFCEDMQSFSKFDTEVSRGRTEVRTNVKLATDHTQRSTVRIKWR